jgi:prepilin signal peptidase PulO-like enzyme (type II secretory pathway)
MKTPTIWWRITLLCAGAAVVTLITFNLVGSTVDAQGVLHEPFFLIPLFWLLSFSSLITAVVALVIRRGR